MFNLWEAGFLGAWGVFFLIGLAIFIVCIVVSIQAKNAGRQGWWIYLIVAFFNPLNLIAIILWFAYFKQNPLRTSDGTPFL